MIYTTRGAYRKSKRFIDYSTIFLTVCISIMFILILFFRSRSGYLFPAIFMAGTILNGLNGAKCFMNGKKAAGVILAVFAAALFIISVAMFIMLLGA